MATKKKLKITIAAEDDTKRAFKSVDNSLGKMRRQTGSAVAFMKKNWFALAAAVAVVGVTINKALAGAEQAAALKQQIDAVDALAAQYQTSADEIVTAMKEVSANNVTVAEGVDIIASALKAGFDDKEIISLTKSYATITRLTGESLPEALAQTFKAFTKGKAIQAAARVGVNDLNSAVKELQASNKDLTLIEAKRQIVLENGILLAEKLGGVNTTLSEAFTGVRNAITDFKDEINLGLLPAFTAGAAGMINFVLGIQKIRLEILELRILTSSGLLGSQFRKDLFTIFPVLNFILDFFTATNEEAAKIPGKLQDITESMKRLIATRDSLTQTIIVGDKQIAAQGGQGILGVIATPGTFAEADKNITRIETKIKKMRTEAKLLADEWVKTKAALELKLEKESLNEFELAIVELQEETNALIDKFGEVPGALEDIEKKSQETFNRIKQDQLDAEIAINAQRAEDAKATDEEMLANTKRTQETNRECTSETADALADIMVSGFFDKMGLELDGLEAAFQDFLSGILAEVIDALGNLFFGGGTSPLPIPSTLGTTTEAIPGAPGGTGDVGFGEDIFGRSVGVRGVPQIPQFARIVAAPQANNLNISIPVNVAGDGRLAQRLKDGIENTVIDIIRRRS
jgi:hypothetical protein